MKKYIIFITLSILIIEKSFSFYVDEITDSFEIVNNSNTEIIEEPITQNTPSSGGGGGGGGGFSGLIMDNCPDGDFSPSYYDGTCGQKPEENLNNEIVIEEEEIILNSAPDEPTNQGNYNSGNSNNETINADINGLMIPGINTFGNIGESDITTEELKNTMPLETVASEIGQLPNTGANQILLLIITIITSSIIFLKRKKY